MKLLIAIPVYNEASDAPGVLNDVLASGHDVLVVDDGSTDGTLAALPTHPRLTVISHQTNQGYGQSLIDAFAFAAKHSYDWVLTMDADGQHEPEQISLFERAIRENSGKAEGADLISGTRYGHAADDEDLPPPERRGVNTAITQLMNTLFGWQLTDAFCGFKAHRVAAMQALHLDEAGYAFPLQLWPRVWGQRQKVIELPVRRIYNNANRTFGGKLDDVRRRVDHYLEVFKQEARWLDLDPRELNEALEQASRDAVSPMAETACAHDAAAGCCCR